MDINELRRARQTWVAEMAQINTDAEGRDLTAEEQATYDGLKEKVASASRQIARFDEVEQLRGSTRSEPGAQPEPTMYEARQAPRQAHYAGDDRQQAELRAVRLYVRQDEGAIREMDAQMRAEARASNDTDLNITTPADGGYLVPTAHYAGIIGRAGAIDLGPRLGVMPFTPEGGTTMNVPVQNAATNEFVSTSEGNDFDRDAPVIDQKAMTLVKFTKTLDLTDELIADEGSQMFTYLDFYVGEALGLTHNKALITEALANGTSVTLAATTLSATDVQTMVYSLKGRHSPSAKWVMRRLTEGALRKLQGSDFLFAETPAGAASGGIDGATLWKYPLFNEDETMPAVGGGYKSLLFGNFGYMGRRATGLTMLYDPYSQARKGKKLMHYFTRISYKVLQAEAILYGRHPTA